MQSSKKGGKSNGKRYMSLNKDIKLIRDGEVLDVKELFIQVKEA